MMSDTIVTVPIGAVKHRANEETEERREASKEWGEANRNREKRRGGKG
jgi:hypothetical protein